MPARITQPFRNRADAADLVPYEDHGMSPEAPIIDFAERHTHGLDVVLMWSRVSGCVWVTVTNRGTAGRDGSKPRRLPRSPGVRASIRLPTGGSVMHATIQQWLPAAASAVAGWLMVRAGASKRMLVLRAPARCASCGRRRRRDCDCREGVR
jgi:hypothetical protein